MRPPARILALLALLSLCLAAATLGRAAAEPIRVAVPAVLRRQTDERGYLIDKAIGGPLAERVQFALQAAPPLPGLEFVERVSLDRILAEQTLALAAGESSSVPAIRAGRLAHADWMLRLRFRTDNLSRPRLEAEVVEALRADLLARVELPLDGLPGTSWYIQPSDSEVALAAELASRALREAQTRARSLEGLPRVAPLTFLNRSGQDRLARLGALLQTALRRPRAGLHVLGYDADDETREESALFLAGVTDLDPASWARVADAFVWGEFEEDAAFAGPVEHMPVVVRLRVWSDDRGPREVTVSGRFGDLPGLAANASEAALALIGPERITDPQTRRRAASDQLAETARALRRETASTPFASAGSGADSVSPVRLVRLALFLDPLNENALRLAQAFIPPGPVHAGWEPDKLALRRALDLAPAPLPPAEPALPSITSARPPLPADLDRSGATTFDPVFALPLFRGTADLLAAADTGPVHQTPWLAADWSPVAPAQRVPPEASRRLNPDFTPAPLALIGDSLWMGPSYWPRRSAKPGVPGAWRLSGPLPFAGKAAALPGFPDAQVADCLPGPDGRLWFSTFGQGVVGLDSASGAIFRQIGADEGLPLSDDNRLFFAPDRLRVGNARQPEGRVIAIAWADGQVTQETPPPVGFLPGLSAAARAAIAAFPDDAEPRVKLPDVPAYAYENKPAAAPSPPHPRISRLDRPDAARPDQRGLDERHAGVCIPTGLADGYWIASLRSVAWAAGTRRVALAHWLHGEIRSLADDGRHLCIAVAGRDSPSSAAPGRLTSQAGGAVTLYLYDYRAGRWRGRMALPPHVRLLAGNERLLLVPANSSPWSMADTRALRATSAPPSPPEIPATPPRPRPTAEQRAKEREKQKTQDQLLMAVSGAACDLDAVRAALAAGASPAEPCVTAAYKKHWDAVDLLLPLLTATELNATTPSPRTETPLGLRLVNSFLRAKQPARARQVIEAGADTAFAKRASLDDDLAWLAIECGDADLVARLHAAGWPLSTEIMQHPLREAAHQKNEPLLRYLTGVSTKDRINDSSGNGQTPLFVAADVGWTEGVRLLLAAGADDFSCDSLTRRQLRDVAAPWPEVAVLLNRRPDAADNQIDGARAVAAVIRGDADALASLPITPAVLRYRDFWSWNVLHHAARHGRSRFVARLLAAGAGPDTLSGYGESALCLAAYSLDADTLSTLLRARADANLREDDGWPPLPVAAHQGRPDMVRALLAAGADPKIAVGPDRQTPLLLAAKASNDDESVRLLIAAGASPDAVDRDGFGPLEYAVLSDSPDKIQYLLDHGARWKKRFDDDYHPMNVAAERGLTRSIRKLQALGLQSMRALSFAKDDATRALLESDDSEAGRLRRLNEDSWTVVLAEPDAKRRRERTAALIAAGGDPNHHSEKWGEPMALALSTDDPDFVRWFIAQGARAEARDLLIWADGSIRPGGPLHRWFTARPDRTKAAQNFTAQDEVALAYLELLWADDRSSAAREDMLAAAEAAGLPRAAAWMRAHLRD